MKKYLSFAFAILIISLSSCDNSPDGRKGMLPNVGGSSGEVVVVIEKAKWEGPVGERLRELLEAPLEGLPQQEPEFNVVTVTPGAFGQLYITHRNVIVVATGAGKKPAALFDSNVYAKTQVIITIEGENDQDILKVIEDQGKLIVDKINIAERDRWISYYRQSINSVNFSTLRDDHKLNLYVPANYSLDVNEKGFAWFSYETPTTTQAILVHYFDYKGENYFNEDSIRAIRNILTTARIKGPVDGTWMVIEDKLPVTYNTFRFRERNYAEMKGLWTLENGYMGGPFVTLVTKDEVNNRFVMLDGFVYAPKDDKRELMRQVEAILFTVNFNIEAEEKK